MADNIDCSFIIVAGGSGNRLGGLPKQFRMLGRRPVWKWSADTADRVSSLCRIREIILVVRPEYRNTAEKFSKDFSVPLHIVDGGQSRTESVINGIKTASAPFVAIHDAARPFVSEKLISDLISKAYNNKNSSIPLLESVDSLKILENNKYGEFDRKKIFRTQTPQVFNTEKLRNVLNSTLLSATDEASLWVEAGYPLTAVDGEEGNFKITTKYDWKRAMATAGEERMQRIGYGYDVHRLIRGRKLILAGVEIKDSALGLLGHSDADVVTHAIMDSLLGAAGEPDIGTLFPASDEHYKDADSMILLKDVVDILHGKGWRIEWVDAVLVAQTPRLGDMVQTFKNNLAACLRENGGSNNVNIKIKSGEECGSVGRAECMVCYAVASISNY